MTSAVGAAADAGANLQRRAVDRVLDSGDLDRVLSNTQLQAVVSQVVSSEGAAQMIDTFFDSGLFDRLVDRLLSSDGLWRLIDVIAASPDVRAALSQQGLGFADQVGEAMRTRSRRADRRLERAAERLLGRPPTGPGQIATRGDEDG